MGLNGKMDREQRNWFILIGSAIALAAMVVGLVIFWPSGNSNEPKTNKDFSLSDAEKTQTETIAEEFITKAGVFGVKENQITNNNLRDISAILSNSAADKTPYWVSRSEGYFNVEDYIAPNSPLSFPTQVVTGWDVPEERNEITNFKVTKVTTDANEAGEYTTYKGNQVKSAFVTVSFSSVQTKHLVTAEDTSWDGSYKILEKTFENQLTVKLVQDDKGEWKVYSLDNFANKFLLATWDRPSRSSYNDTQFDFKEVEILTPDEPIKPKVPNATPTPTPSSNASPMPTSSPTESEGN